MNAPVNPSQLMPQWADINDFDERVLEADEFIVFINKKGNCDYKTTDAYDKAGPRDKAKCARLMSEAAAVENLSHDFLSNASKLAFKKLVGEAIVRCLQHEYVAAKYALDLARNYIERRQNRQSRHWYLAAAVVFTLLLTAPFFVYLGYMAPAPLTIFTEHLLFIEAGFLGALFSIMWRMGKTSFDADAEKSIHQLEAFVKILGGGLAAALVMLAVKSKILFANLLNPDNEIYILLFLCAAAGAAEKWVPSLIATVGKQKLNLDAKE